MKLGISLKIDVTKIDKARLFQGKKGTYLDITTFIDVNNPGEHGDHGFITQELTKDERDNKVQLPILGNTKVFYNSESVKSHREGIDNAQNTLQGQQQAEAKTQAFDDEIPFS